jgi:predicted acyltransferase
VDIRGWRRWGFFFKVIGMNAITVYILVRTVFNWQFESQYFFGDFVTQAGMMAIVWLFLLWLYRKNVFLRV